MPRTPLRRLLTGLFAVWFVALGVTRGTYMACLDHRAAHLAAVADARAASTMPAAAHAGHAGHGAAHEGHGVTAVAAHDDAASSQGTPDDAPDHCTCAGDCCCAVPAQAPPRATIACAPEARVAPPRPAFVQTARPSDVVPYLLPFATAPPALTQLS